MRMSKHAKEKLRRERPSRPWEGFRIGLFFAVLGAIAVLGLCLPLRPHYSESEKRELTKFPVFSLSSLFSGEYFDGISTWYADTFPFREFWVKADSIRQNTFGLRFSHIQGDVESGDEIPDVPSEPSRPSATESNSAATTQTTTTTTTAATVTTAAPESSGTVPPTADPGLDRTQSFGAVLQIGDTAYEYYNFNRSVADRYAAMLNKAGKTLEGKAHVYALIPPNSMGIMLPDSMRNKINSSDQGKASRYIFSQLTGNAVGVPVYDVLMSHRDEYIYFRTDHHWTATGAYYGYAELMRAMGKTAAPLSSYETKEFTGFLGTFYSDTKKPAAMEKHPDTVVAYLPKGDTSLHYTDRSGKTYAWPLIHDVGSYPKGLKYSCFIAGDNPYTKIENRSLSDGSACVVIKESYGNALIPFLTDQYQTVHVIDYRYYKKTLRQFLASESVSDVIFINNISATRSSTLVGYLEKLVG